MPYSSIQYPLLLAVKAKILTLLTAGSLPTLTASTPLRVRAAPSFHDFGLAAQKKPYTWPGIIVSNASSESDVPVTNNSQDRGYNVLVTIADQLEGADVAAMLESTVADSRLAWRDVIINNLVPAGVNATDPTRVFNRAEYVGGQVVDWRQLASEKRWVTSMMFRFWTRVAHV